MMSWMRLIIMRLERLMGDNKLDEDCEVHQADE